MATQTLDSFLEQSRSFNVIPLHMELMADVITPVVLLQLMKDQYPQSKRFLFESVEHGTSLSRYSFAGYSPVESLITRGGKTVLLSEKDQIEKPIDNGRYFDVLDSFLHRFRSSEIEGLPVFTGGLVGYSSYDTIREIEQIGEHAEDDLGLPDAIWSFYTSLFAFDHVYQKLHLIHLVLLEGDETYDELVVAYKKGIEQLQNMKRMLHHQTTTDLSLRVVPDSSELEVRTPKSRIERDEFLKMVDRAKSHIYEGDAFQIVLSQRFEIPYQGSEIELYRALRLINPSPYLFCLDLGAFQLIGSSPEILVQCNQGEITLLPIAGTRPRGVTIEEDEALEKHLLADEKEIAEHTMLIDLGRNDLSRVCEPGSVKMIRELSIERFSHVMHIVSEIKGKLSKGKSAVDALKSCFPAGTVSGAPKIRAMQIIEELEPVKRGPYAGAIGYFDLSGNMDTCIAIRTICLVEGKAYIQAGAGIVADSDPQKEFEETQHKAGALVRAVEFAKQISTKQ